MKKPRRRYVAFKVNGELNTDSVWKAVGEALRGISPPPRLILFDESIKRGLLKCNHLQVGEVKGVLGGLSVGGASFIIIGVSGTIRACKRKFLLGSVKTD